MDMNFAAMSLRGSSGPTLQMWEQSGEKLNRYEVLACLLTHRTNATVADGVHWLRQLTRDLNIPPLRTYGMTEADIPAICENAASASSMKANPIVLTKDELAAVLRSAL
jgi:alcohol dehydrogenase class IV